MANLEKLVDDLSSLTVLEAAPAIDTQPASQIVCVEDPVTFEVVATGEELSYQWRKDETPIDGETGDSLTIASAAVEDEGSYDCVVTNADQRTRLLALLADRMNGNIATALLVERGDRFSDAIDGVPSIALLQRFGILQWRGHEGRRPDQPGRYSFPAALD